MTKYEANDQEEYLLANNLLGAKEYEELEQLERVAFYYCKAIKRSHYAMYLDNKNIKTVYVEVDNTDK